MELNIQTLMMLFFILFLVLTESTEELSVEEIFKRMKMHKEFDKNSFGVLI